MSQTLSKRLWCHIMVMLVCMTMCMDVLAVGQTKAQSEVEASTSRQDEVYRSLDPKWRSCTRDNECRKVRFDCFGVVAVNEKYLKDARERVCDQRSCDWLSCTAKTANIRAECRTGVCQTVGTTK
jgi:hypothetical protein